LTTSHQAATEAPGDKGPLSEARQRRATLSIALSVGLCSGAFNFYWPFLPLFLLDVGAKSEADALFWVAIGTAVQGVARLVTGPVWGVFSDRYGRKMMFLRALYFGSLTTLIMTFVNEPWQVAIGFACQGLFSGFVPAAVALVSVSVSDSRLNSSLSFVTGAQYLGTTVGPALGALLAILLDFRGAILVAAALPAIIGTAVIFLVPADRVVAREGADGGGPRQRLEPFRPNAQFALAVFAFFVIFSLAQLLRLVTPIALNELAPDSVEGLTGLAFTLGGLTSALSLLFLSGHIFRAGRMRSGLVLSSVFTGLAFGLLAVQGPVVLFIAGFALISLLQTSMIPATNTLIAANVSRERRGTAFGVAGSAQALAFMTGPLGAALFAALSLGASFAVMGAMFVALAVLLLAVREPSLTD
jgi:DHA1 family multidrug resistance protein-like MFS transporter